MGFEFTIGMSLHMPMGFVFISYKLNLNDLCILILEFWVSKQVKLWKYIKLFDYDEL